MILQPLTYDAALYVVSNMRDSDYREIYATRVDRDPRSLAEGVAGLGPYAWAAGRDGEPIACCGAYQLWPGCWQAWMFATDSFDKIGKRLTRHTLRVIIPAVRAAGARRVQCFSIDGHQQAHRWLEQLGAERESTLARYGIGGEDFIVYRWLM